MRGRTGIVLPAVLAAVSIGLSIAPVGPLSGLALTASSVAADHTTTFVSAAPTSPTISAVVASPTAVPVGFAGSTITVGLLATKGTPEQRKEVMLVPMSGDPTVTMESDPTDKNGQATFNVTDTNVESVCFSIGDLTDSLSIPRHPCVRFVGGPPAITPETPFTVALPVTAAGVLGGAAHFARRRRVMNTSRLGPSNSELGGSQ